MNLATVSAINALTAVTELLSGGHLVLYSGTQPLTPESSLNSQATNTALATFVFNTPAFSSSNLTGGNEQQTASFVSNSVTPGANNTVVWARAYMQTTNWIANTAYVVGNVVVANSNLYYCTKAGTSLNSGSGPSGTSNSIVDNPGTTSVVWQYLAPSTQTVVADFSVNTASADIIIGNTTLSTTINVTITSFILQIPAS